MEKSKVQEILEEVGYEVRSYSGRNMYGKYCLAVETHENITDIIAEIVEEMDDAYESAKVIRKIKMDQMGRGNVYYFPGIEFVDKDKKEEEE